MLPIGEPHIIGPMLLTDALVEEIHNLRITMMRSFIQSYQTVQPDKKGMEFGGGYASFAGAGIPMSQVYGMGHRGASFNLDEVDEFYRGFSENWELILTPFASTEALQGAVAHGYLPDHFESVMAQYAPEVTLTDLPGVTIEKVTGDYETWMRTSDAAWSGAEELPDSVSDLAQVMTVNPATQRYLAWCDGEPAATAAMGSYGGRYFFAGASTRTKFRGRGLQRALTQRRLYDAGPGNLVEVITSPGSLSHRNAQRSGFQPLYSKLILFRHPVQDPG